MSVWVHLITKVYRVLLVFYPSDFRVEFGEEMEDVFATALTEAQRPSHATILVTRELRDLPSSVWREHLRARKRIQMDQNLTWRPATTKELLTVLTLFLFPTLPSLLKLMFGYLPLINRIGYLMTIALLTFSLIVLVYGLKRGFPRWAIPYLGVAVTSIVILEPSWRIWSLFASDVQRVIGYYAKTLQVRVLYQALMWGFFYSLAFVSAVLLILFLMIWPRTRQLAQRIRMDWTLFSFMLFGGLAFQLELIFEEYAYDELWKIACRACLALGAWMYYKSVDARRRILALLAGATLIYWIAAVGKWYLVPHQTWGAFHGYDYETYSAFEFWRTLAEWGWTMLFLLIPAALTLIPLRQEPDHPPGENLAPS